MMKHVYVHLQISDRTYSWYQEQFIYIQRLKIQHMDLWSPTCQAQSMQVMDVIWRFPRLWDPSLRSGTTGSRCVRWTIRSIQWWKSNGLREVRTIYKYRTGIMGLIYEHMYGTSSSHLHRTNVVFSSLLSSVSLFLSQNSNDTYPQNALYAKPFKEG